MIFIQDKQIWISPITLSHLIEAKNNTSQHRIKSNWFWLRPKILFRSAFGWKWAFYLGNNLLHEL